MSFITNFIACQQSSVVIDLLKFYNCSHCFTESISVNKPSSSSTFEAPFVNNGVLYSNTVVFSMLLFGQVKSDSPLFSVITFDMFPYSLTPFVYLLCSVCVLVLFVELMYMQGLWWSHLQPPHIFIFQHLSHLQPHHLSSNILQLFFCYRNFVAFSMVLIESCMCLCVRVWEEIVKRDSVCVLHVFVYVRMFAKEVVVVGYPDHGIFSTEFFGTVQIRPRHNFHFLVPPHYHARGCVVIYSIDT